MRQLGARLPVAPPAETDVVETPQNVPPASSETVPTARRAVPPAPADMPQPEPYRVEVHRIEPQPVDSGPPPPAPPPPPPSEPLGVRLERDAAGRLTGRWAEFHESQQPEVERGRRLDMAPMLRQDDQLWARPRVQQEREHHSPFLTLAVPGIAAILAIGALLWSGALRDRVRQQDAAMTALQQQNHKLADALAEMNVEQKANGALNDNSDSSNAPAADATQKGANDAPAPQQSAQTAAQPAEHQTPAAGDQGAANQPEGAGSQPASEDGSASAPVQRQSSRQPERRGAGNREGVSTPPPAGQGDRTPRQNGSRHRGAVQTAYTPELVPPYPTSFQPQNVTAQAATSQPLPSAGVSNAAQASGATTAAGTGQAVPQAYAQPVSVPSSSGARSIHSTSQIPAQTRTQSGAPQAGVAQSSGGRSTSAPPPSTATATPYNAGANPYSAAADGSYASPLAENIEVVQGLQRHSPVPLREFHADQSRFAKVTPSLGVSVRRPDPGHGTYALAVDEGGRHYQLAGRVNSPVTLTDTATHREYALIVLRVDNGQVYGYLRPMQ
jgi:hypothetical protein